MPTRTPADSRRGELTARAFEIAFLLDECPRTQAELASLLGVSKKTVKRYIDALPDRFLQVFEERNERGEMVYTLKGFRPPPLTLAELSTLLLARQSISATRLTAFGTPFAEAGCGLLAKIRAAMPEGMRDKLDELSRVYGTALIPAKDYSAFAETIHQLTTAAAERRRVRMLYRSHGRPPGERAFEPYAVYFDPDGGTLKTLGHDAKSGEIRPFNVDHILRLEVTDEPFERPADFDFERFMEANCFNGIHGDPVTVRLRATGLTANVFAERKFHPSQKTLLKTGEAVEIELTVAGGRGLERFILGWLPDVEVLSPPDLREKISGILKNFLNR
jgi:predicted DNA-binding transcriptional regulator YafY